MSIGSGGKRSNNWHIAEGYLTLRHRQHDRLHRVAARGFPERVRMKHKEQFRPCSSPDDRTRANSVPCLTLHGARSGSRQGGMKKLWGRPRGPTAVTSPPLTDFANFSNRTPPPRASPRCTRLIEAFPEQGHSEDHEPMRRPERPRTSTARVGADRRRPKGLLAARARRRAGSSIRPRSPITCRSRSDWTRVPTLPSARALARCQAELEREQRENGPRSGPDRATVLRRELALRRALRSGSVDRSADAAARRMLERAAEDAARDQITPTDCLRDRGAN